MSRTPHTAQPSLPALVAGGAYGVFVLLLATIWGFFVGTTMVVPFVFVPRGRREAWTIHGARLWAWTVVRCFLLARPVVTGTAPDPRVGALVMCNHRSWLDPLLLIAYAWSNGLSKQQIFYLPVIGQYGWLTGAVFFDRTDREQRARARDEVMMLVRSGFRIQLFPEGTRSRTGELREKVYLTLAMDCFAQGLPVIPAAVHRTERTLPPGVFAAFPGQKVYLDIGEPIEPAGFERAVDFAQHCWDEVGRRVTALEQCP